MTNRSIVHQVTRRYMHSQIGRTRISFIGIVLMVTLMTCVFVGKDTVLAYFTEITETHYGKWHMAVYDITESQLAQIQALSGVKETAVSQNLHYTAFPQSGDELHPYLNLRTYSDKAFDWMNIQVVEGSGDIGTGVRTVVLDVAIPNGVDRKALRNQTIVTFNIFLNATDGHTVSIFGDD